MFDRSHWKQMRPTVYAGLLILVPVMGSANPTGGVVVGGAASIQNVNPNKTVINQTSPNTVINWQSFNIGSGQTTQFIQPSASSIAVNRVVGGNPTAIFGYLTANGKIVIINPRGIWFGPGSVVDVGSLVATTNNITNTNAMNGKLQFEPLPANSYQGSVINDGTITVAKQGLVALMAPGVANRGVIQANLGEVVLASGKSYTLDFSGDKLINFAIPESSTQAGHDEKGNKMNTAVSNSGNIIADGGRVTLTARTASKVVENAINVSGVIQANSVVQKNGEIYLVSSDQGTVAVTGQLTAKGTAPGTKGGKVVVTGKKVQLAKNAKIDVSGDAGGGSIRIGGDTRGQGTIPTSDLTTIGSDVELHADAYTYGDGGDIVVWANDHTDMFGTATALGGALGGNGGFIETSGKETIDFSGARVSAYAPMGNSGLWLVDPSNININNALATAIENSLAAGTSFLLDATTGMGGSGEINVNSPISAPVTVGTPTLTFTSADTIEFNDPVTGDFNFTINAGGNVELNANAAIDVVTLTITPTGSFDLLVNDPTTITADTHHYNLPINLLENLTLNSTIANNINGGVIGDDSSNLVLTGPAAFNGTMTGIDVLTASGPVTINTGTVTTNLTQTYSSTVTLAQSTNLTGTTISLNGNVVGGGNNLTITGNANLGNAVSDSLTGVGALTITGNANIFDSVVTTTGAQDYQGNVTLLGDVNFTASSVDFEDNIVGNTHDLTVTGNAILGSTGTDTFTGVNDLTITGSTAINLATISTSGNQTFQGDVTLNRNVNFSTSNNLTFDSNIIGNNFDLTANSASVFFGDGVGVDTVTGINDLSVEDATMKIGAALTTTGTQNYSGIFTLGNSNMNVTGTSVAIDNIIGNNFNLAITGPATLGTGAGSTITGLTDLTLNNTVSLNLPSITTAGVQHYVDTVTLQRDLSLTGTNLLFDNNIIGNSRALTLQSPATLGTNSTNSITGLTTLTANGALTVNNGAISSSGNQTYNGIVSFLSPITLTATGGIVSFLNDVNANNNNVTVTGAAKLGNLTTNTFTNFNDLTISGNTTLQTASLNLAGTLQINGTTTLAGGDKTITAPTITMNSIVGGGNSLDLTGAITLGTGGASSVSGVNNFTLHSPATLNLASITSTGTQDYLGNLNVLNNLSLSGPNINIDGSITGNTHSLSVTAGTQTTFGSTGAETFSGLTTVNVNGLTNFNLASLTSSGAQNYNGNSNLLFNTDLTGSNIAFNGSIIGNGNNLTTHGNTSFGNTGAQTVTGVAQLAVNGNTTMNVANITTTGTQTYTGNVSLSATPTLSGTGTTTITGNLTGNNNDFISQNDLAIGTTTGNSISTLNNMNVTGNADFNIGSLGASSITASGTQTHHLNFALTKNIAFNGGQTTILGNVAAGNRTVTFNGNTTLGSDGTQTWSNISTLLGNAPINLNVSSIAANIVQTYLQPITLLANVGLSAPVLNIHSNVAGGGFNLTLTGGSVNLGTTGTETMSGLGNFTVNGPTHYRMASISGSGTQDYNGVVTLLGPLDITGSTNTFHQNIVGGGFDFTSHGTTVFDGMIAGIHDLRVVGATEFNTGSVTTSNLQHYQGGVTINNPMVFNAGGAFTVDGPMVLNDPVTINTSNDPVTFNNVITGSKNMTFNLGSGNLAFNGVGTSYLGEVVVNNVGAISNNGHINVLEFNQNAGSNQSDFGLGTLDAGYGIVYVTTNGDILGRIIAGDMTLRSLFGTINVDVLAYYTLTTFSTNGVTITGSVGGVSGNLGNPFILANFFIESGSIGLVYFNGQLLANRSDDASEENSRNKQKAESLHEDEYQRNHKNIFGEEDHSCA